MKLIALRDFRNNTEPRLDVPDPLHSDHVHKGAVFSIGVDKAGKDIPEFDDLSKSDQELVGLLKLAGCIGDATNEKLVKRITKEVDEDAKRIERDKATVKAAGSQADLLAQLVALLKPQKT